jgi:hypothetical protein
MHGSIARIVSLAALFSATCPAVLAGASDLNLPQRFHDKYEMYVRAYSSRDVEAVVGMWAADYTEVSKRNGRIVTVRRSQLQEELADKLAGSQFPTASIRIQSVELRSDGSVDVLIYASYADQGAGSDSSKVYLQKQSWVPYAGDWILRHNAVLKEDSYESFMQARGNLIESGKNSGVKGKQVYRPFVEALSRADKLARQHFIRGEQAAFRGDRETAIREWREVLKLKPDSEHTKMVLEVALTNQSKEEE